MGGGGGGGGNVRDDVLEAVVKDDGARFVDDVGVVDGDDLFGAGFGAEHG